MNPAFENLEKLSQDLYQKLIKDAEAEIEQMQQKAAEERAQLKQEAIAEADSYRKKAEREVALSKEKSLQDLQQEALQLRGKLEKDLQNFLKEGLVKAPMNSLMQSEDFVQSMVLELLKRFDPQNHELIWPANWSEKWLEQIKAKLPEWRFVISEDHSLLIRESNQGLEFHFSQEAFEKLLENYFDQELRPLILGHA